MRGEEWKKMYSCIQFKYVNINIMSFVGSKRFNAIVMKNSSTYQDANILNTFPWVFFLKTISDKQSSTVNILLCILTNWFALLSWSISRGKKCQTKDIHPSIHPWVWVHPRVSSVALQAGRNTQTRHSVSPPSCLSSLLSPAPWTMLFDETEPSQPRKEALFPERYCDDDDGKGDEQRWLLYLELNKSIVRSMVTTADQEASRWEPRCGRSVLRRWQGVIGVSSVFSYVINSWQSCVVSDVVLVWFVLVYSTGRQSKRLWPRTAWLY